MRVVLQRVSSAKVTIEGAVVGSIDRGYLLLAGFGQADTSDEVEWMAAKISGLRLFPDEAQRMNRCLVDVGGAILVVSQFTLYGDIRRGRRPSFIDAAAPEVAEELYQAFLAALRKKEIEVRSGTFGAMMEVMLVNDGPVTLILER